ncbi:hypothetical protein B0H14DRAFT_3016379 [Mycena olivaceomarginata]|nr:hypothetical protein B0H14DRAFT_3016379 [Mycena olivaceomarginata]
MEPPPNTGLLYVSLADTDESDIPAPGSRRRRLRGACQTCRLRKGDSAKMPGGVCSNCIQFNSQCTRFKSDNLKKRTASRRVLPLVQDEDPYDGKTASEHVDSILRQSTAYIAAQDLRNILLDIARYSRELEQELEKVVSQLSSARRGSEPLSPLPERANPPSDEDGIVDSSPDGIMMLVEEFKDMALSNAARPVFFGRSSGLYLMKTAQELQELHGPGGKLPPPTRRRDEFWHSPWEITPPPPNPVYKFPPKDLLDDLVSLYFDRINILVGVCHRPTFERSVASGLHLVDHSFGAVVLAVCALASRTSNDPRVVLEGTNSKLSSGWEWFQQIQYPGRDFHVARSLHDLQRICLSVQYLQGTCSPDAVCALVAVGIRNLQELGIHIRGRYHGHHRNLSFATAVEEELYTRVFWCLLTGDSLISSFFGRPRIMMDDEQPAGKPSVYAYLVAYFKLLEILGTVQKKIYAVRRFQRNSTWSQAVVTELDSLLNQWLKSIPDHLRWDPTREDEPFATQSACLYVCYYHVQIQIHRSFIPSPMNHSPLTSTFPALAICANSARFCSWVMEVQARRGLITQPHVVSAIMDSAIVILLNVWGPGRAVMSDEDPQRAMNDVQKCIKVLKMYEVQWREDIGEYCAPLVQTLSDNLQRHPSSTSTTSASPEITEPSPSNTASSTDEYQDSQHVDDSEHYQYSPSPGNMPISTEDLGHWPVYQSWGIPFEGDLSGGLSYNNFDGGAYDSHSHLELASIARPHYPSDYVQPNSYPEYQSGDWATYDWTAYQNIGDHKYAAVLLRLNADPGLVVGSTRRRAQGCFGC